ncbi:MAG TPA: CaiB/BaiF CoA-transferase family protein [Candidatus Binataceae bacterium]|nr:CaiB/BaiF CoA-transferase family protein [Candidatus Binataceae bacterium]
MKKALDDIRVVEYAEMVSGPMCGKMFSDMGAEVIKIEPPGRGDESRGHPPFPDDVPHPEKSGMFLYLNTGKKSVTLDPAAPSGAAIFKRLITGADLLIENHAPGFLDRAGLGYDSLHALNPRLIVVSITPFGQSGPYRDWKGSDLVEWAMSLTGYNTPTLVDDEERENPLRAPGHAAEMMGATNAAASAMMALFHRDLTGEGQWVDAPCWQATVNTAKIEMAAHSYVGIPFSRLRAKVQVGLEPLPCRDGYVYTLWAADAHFQALKQLLGNPPGLDTELFDTLAGRHEHDDALRAIVREELVKHDMEYLVTEGQRLGLTIGPVHTVPQAANHPHLAAREAFVEVDHPVAGRFRYPHHLVSLTATPPAPVRAPLLGEHNSEILEGLGISREQQQGLRAAGVI